MDLMGCILDQHHCAAKVCDLCICWFLFHDGFNSCRKPTRICLMPGGSYSMGSDLNHSPHLFTLGSGEQT